MTPEQARAAVGERARITGGPGKGERVVLTVWESERPNLVQVQWVGEPSADVYPYLLGGYYASDHSARGLWPVDRLELVAE